MKKLILLFTVVCFVGVAKMNAQSTATSKTQTTTVVAKETPAKAETKKACCSHSGKSCCMSKDASSSKKECKQGHAEKAEGKPEKETKTTN